MLSPGGVHSHERQIFAMLDLAKRAGVARVAVHAFLDGRDTPPQSAQSRLAALQRECDAPGHARHQMAVLDEATGTVMAGDALGVQFADAGLYPAIPHPEFELEQSVRYRHRSYALGAGAVLLGPL